MSNASLSIGIVGLPNVGKSTLFQTLTKKQVDRANYPFCTIEPNVGVVAVPDERVDQLAHLTRSAKKIHATIEFVDIAGLVKNAHQGEGLGNQFLAHIRETDAIVYVLRAFANKDILSVQEKVDPLEDKEILETELILKDLETIEKKIQGLTKEARSGQKEAIQELAFLNRIREILISGKLIIDADWNETETKKLKTYQLLTFKPKLYLFNGTEKDLDRAQVDFFSKNGWPFLIIDVLTEFETVDFNPDERISLGLKPESGLNQLIKKSYDLLDLITFFTTGPDETRAWPIKKNSTAPIAGGVIHSDFEKYFIRAEIINWQTLIQSGGYARARERGLIRTEGREYIIQDGDVIEIKHGR